MLVVAGAGYAYEARQWRSELAGGPGGGHGIGLVLGIVAAGLVVFAALRGLRRWMPGGVIDSDAWGRAHVWLGLLVVPLAWLHGGFRHGGALTSVTMWLLYVIVISGAVGALLRRVTSRPVTSGDRLPADSLDEPVEQSIARLAAEAEDVVAVCGPMNGRELEDWRAETMTRVRTRAEADQARREAMLSTIAAAPVARSEPLRELYALSIKPYLERGGQRGGAQEVMASRVKAGQLLRRCRAMVPDELAGTVTELERICDDCRRLRLRQRLQRYVDGWMLIHGPLSVAVVVLLVLHGVFALRY